MLDPFFCQISYISLCLLRLTETLATVLQDFRSWRWLGYDSHRQLIIIHRNVSSFELVGFMTNGKTILLDLLCFI